MYLFIYKTFHKNGSYYIGRHQTKNLNDGYLGSGNWVRSIKDKSLLERTIIAEASSIEELYKLEEYYIDLHWNDPLCMNMTKASVGWTSEDATKYNTDRVKNGTNPFLKRSDGTSITSDMVKNGTHPCRRRPDGTSIVSDKVNAGTHNLLRRPDGTSLASDRVKNGTHHLVGAVTCYDKSGKCVHIPKELFYSQEGPKENRQWVHVTSKEGKKRKLLNNLASPST